MLSPGHCAKIHQPFTSPNRKFTLKNTPCGRQKSRHRSKSVRQKDLLLSKSVNFKLEARGTPLPRQLLNCTAVSTRRKCWPGSSLGTSEGPAECAAQSQRRRGGGGSDAEVLGAPSSQTHGLRSQLSPQTQHTTAERGARPRAPPRASQRRITYLVEASPEPTFPSWELSWAWLPS